MADGWWNNNGAIANCVAAYQPIGAASLAASYVNLFNPGTYDGTVVNAPTFDASYGWSFTAASQQAVKTGVLATSTMTMIIRFSDFVQGNIMGCISTIGFQFMLIWTSSTTMKIGSGIWSGPGNCVAENSPKITSGVYGLAGKTGYRNGSADTNVCGAGTGAAALGIPIGARAINGTNSLDEYGTLKVQAVSIYSAVLDAPTMATLAALMAALPVATGGSEILNVNILESEILNSRIVR